MVNRFINTVRTSGLQRSGRGRLLSVGWRGRAGDWVEVGSGQCRYSALAVPVPVFCSVRHCGAERLVWHAAAAG